MNSPYSLDRTHAKLMGVCAGFARWLDVDPTLTRVLALLSLLVLGPIMIAAYLITGFVTGDR